MCEANWNHAAFLVVLQTTISMELEFNLSQYSISSQCLHIDHEKSALENISAMPQLFSPVANFPQQYWYSPSCVGRIKSTLPKFLGPTETQTETFKSQIPILRDVHSVVKTWFGPGCTY